MSELKAFRIIQGDTGGYGAPSYKCDPDGNRLEEWSDICEVYDRSEVDSYLYEKEEQHQHEVSLLLIHLAEKDKKINILQQSLQSSETVSAYRKRTIKEYEVKVDRMRMDIAEKDRYISNLKDDVAELQAKYMGCKRELDLLKDTQAFYDGESK